MRRISIPKACVKEASSEADSGPFSATDVNDASNARSAAQRTIERCMAGEVEADSYGLPPEAERG